ncbi:GMC oxidoreductase-like protein [Lineolata rhizophorae]|uniref:GMC oxidoreductase-like protein n=1 Tax=Lineolata rhizophorae TaxID=578093 RepID=A0A6A6PAE6_9PEZI|nr:GMC oxidoreductase-like protein [Lineolata rhizophorae]
MTRLIYFTILSEFALLFGAPLVSTRPLHNARVIRDAAQVQDESYSFVIVGGGTAGLTLADRLKEAFPSESVLVVEFGALDDSQEILMPSDGVADQARLFDITSVPNAELNGRDATVSAGKVVGGSSAVDGQFFDRASREDIDSWAALGSPEWNNLEIKWGWDDLLQYYKRSTLFHSPPLEVTAQFGYAWDNEAAYGVNQTTQIDATFPPFQWPIQSRLYNAWAEYGLERRVECAAGGKYGICWAPSSQDPDMQTRSYARTAHWDEVPSSQRYDLLPNHKVTSLSFPNGLLSPPSMVVQRVDSGSSDADIVVTAEFEVILSAGAVHTPQILQRSGIGPRELLESAGIEVAVELPGVGQNFQDHPSVPGYDTNSLLVEQTFYPDPSMISTNETFVQQALDNYFNNQTVGPYTMGSGNTAVYVPLKTITEDYEALANVVLQQAQGASEFLASSADATYAAGYSAQLSVIADMFKSDTAPTLEGPFSDSPNSLGVLLKPLSRGTVMLDPANLDAEPLVDYRTFSNPVDVGIMSYFIPYLRGYYETSIMQAMGPTEMNPGAEVTDQSAMIDYLRQTAMASYADPCCTAAMMPVEKGGVVGPDLKVHGTEALRVVDASVFPLIPGAHLSATVYAVAEKAAEIIVGRWQGEVKRRQLRR